ncbi:cytochrome protein [Talaromyces proteolyticus]|uniref:Cytochrome protein n=1 Tax=Talaromyces proteolyticus TaxID=1131652 RepID=A0AAD4PW22_9EURO|nr:cytochrome protein [Talaromyces proteolyticus]KAH8692038.1 cytochrome protein [Talaromyces proteolyticus]
MVFLYIGASFTSWTAVLLWSLLTLCISIVGQIIYRLTLHPLAGFPGPKLTAATKWYEVYFELVKRPQGQFSREIDRMHDRYGPIVRINPDELHVRDSDWYDVFYAPSTVPRDKYPPAANMAGTGLGTFGTVRHELHRRRRAADAPLFSKRSIQQSESLIKEQLQRLTATFKKASVSDEPLNLGTSMLAFSTTTLGLFAFNFDFNFLDDAKAAENWRKTIDSVTVVTIAARQFPWLIPLAMMTPRALARPVLPDLCRLLDAHVRIGEQVSNYMLTRTEPKGKVVRKERPLTIFQAIDESSLPAHEKNAPRLTQEGITLLLAGGETVARSLIHIIFHLLDNPDVYAKVKAEIDDATPKDQLIPSTKTLESLPWLTASVRESLRLSAVVSSRLPEMARTKIHYGEWVIPANTPVSLHPSSVLHDPSVYPEPSKFKPERWFDASDRANRCFVPFGKGARMCLGMDFAYTQIFMTIATFLRTFDLELYETYRARDIDQERDCFVGMPSENSPGVRVKVHMRLGNLDPMLHDT